MRASDSRTRHAEIAYFEHELVSALHPVRKLSAGYPTLAESGEPAGTEVLAERRLLRLHSAHHPKLFRHLHHKRINFVRIAAARAAITNAKRTLSEGRFTASIPTTRIQNQNRR